MLVFGSTDESGGGARTFVEHIELPERSWEITVTSQSTYNTGWEQFLPESFLMVGLKITILIAAYVIALTRLTTKLSL